MRSDEHGVIPLYSTPIYHAKDTGFRCSEKELNTIENLRCSPSSVDSCLLAQNEYVLNLNPLSRIKKECEKQLRIYTKEVLCINQDFYITNSWVTKKSLSSGYKSHHEHRHPNSIFSGVLYLDVEEGNDQKLFFHGKPGILHEYNFEYKYSNLNIYNSEVYWIPVALGTCLIFPSQLVHWVEEFKTGGQRIVLGFNCFVKGKFGGKGYATDLFLKGP